MSYAPLVVKRVLKSLEDASVASAQARAYLRSGEIRAARAALARLRKAVNEVSLLDVLDERGPAFAAALAVRAGLVRCPSCGSYAAGQAVDVSGGAVRCGRCFSGTVGKRGCLNEALQPMR